ncbi:MAG: M48 family metallopeptidase [Planctomycetota bacterium]
MSVRGGRWLLVLCILAWTPSCRSVGKTLGNLLVPVDQEVAMGNQYAAELDKELKELNDPTVQRYVEEIGQKIVSVCDRQDIEYHFTVIDDPKTVNAFAVPGGHLYVYTGLLLAAENESEVAGVMGHEVGHVVARHSANQMAQAMVASAGVSAVQSALSSGDESTDWVAMAGGVLSNVAAQGYLLKYGRDDETESDALAVEYTIATGYDPNGMATFLEKLYELSGGQDPSGFEAILASHPPTLGRVEHVRELIAEAGNPGGYVGREEHEKIKARLRR